MDGHEQSDSQASRALPVSVAELRLLGFEASEAARMAVQLAAWVRAWDGVHEQAVGAGGESCFGDLGVTLVARVTRLRRVAGPDPDNAGPDLDLAPFAPVGRFCNPGRFGQAVSVLLAAGTLTAPMSAGFPELVVRSALVAARIDALGEALRASPPDLGAAAGLLDGLIPDPGDPRGPWDMCDLMAMICGQRVGKRVAALQLKLNTSFPLLGRITFADNITSLTPAAACPGDVLTLKGTFGPLRGRARVKVAFPTSAGCVPTDFTIVDDETVHVVVPAAAKPGCVGFVDLDALDRYNQRILEMNLGSAGLGDVAMLCLGIRIPIVPIPTLKNPCAPCTGVNYFSGGALSVQRFTVDGTAGGIEVDVTSQSTVVVAWDVVGATTVHIQGPGFMGWEPVAAKGSRSVPLPAAPAPVPMTWELRASSPCSGTVVEFRTVTAVAVPTLVVSRVESLTAFDKLSGGGPQLVRRQAAVFRVFAQHDQAAGTTLAAQCVITVRHGTGATVVLPAQPITVVDSGIDPDRDTRGLLFVINGADLDYYGCVRVHAEVTWTSPAGSLSSTQTGSWLGSVTHPTHQEIYVYTTTFGEGFQTQMPDIQNAFEWLREILPTTTLGVVPRGNLEIWHPFTQPHQAFNGGDSWYLNVVLDGKASWFDGRVCAALVDEKIPTSGADGACMGRGFWIRRLSCYAEMALHEYLHAHGRDHFEASGAGCSVAPAPYDAYQPDAPNGRILQPVAVPAGWGGDQRATGPGRFWSGGEFATAGLDVRDGATQDVMTYCMCGTAHGRYQRAWLFRWYWRDPQLVPIEPYVCAGACVRGEARRPELWLNVLRHAGTTAIWVSACAIPLASTATIRWALENREGVVAEGALPPRQPNDAPAHESVAFAIPYEPGATALRYSAHGAEVTVGLGKGSSAGELRVEQKRGMPWAATLHWKAPKAAKRAWCVEVRAGDAEPWQSVAFLVTGARSRAGGECVLDVDLSGYRHAEAMTFRVIEVRPASRVAAWRAWEATTPWRVPEPSIAISGGPRGDASLVAGRHAFYATVFSFLSGGCVTDESIEWFLDGELAGKGPSLEAMLRPGERTLRVRCARDDQPAGEETFAFRVVEASGPDER